MTTNLMKAAKSRLDNLLPKASLPERRFRERAWERMEKLGWPGRKSETWRYTTLAPVERHGGDPVAVVPELPASLESRLTSLESDFIVIRPGAKLSSPQFTVRDAEFTSEYLGEDAVSNLSAAVAWPGTEIEIAAGAEVSKPLLLVKYQQAEAGWRSAFHRVVVNAGAKVQVAELLVGENVPYLRTDLTQIKVADKARIHWLRIQKEGLKAHHFSETQIELNEGSGFHFTQWNEGAGWVRSQILCELRGRGAEANVQGLTFGSSEQQIDQRVVVSHHSGETASSQLFKGVYKDRSRGVFNGKIYIAQDAQKVDSKQLNQNLLLGPGAEVNTKPELEIYADDVKANHGASVGRLDEEKIFYLRSRGIPPEQVESLLSQAFVTDVIMKIPDSGLRRLLESVDGF